MKKLTILNLSLILIFVSSVLAQAQNAISYEKKKLIAELVAVTKTDKQIVEITDVILKSMETTYPIGFERSVDSRKDLTAKEKEKLKAAATESFLKFSKKFRERLPQAVNYNQYIEETIYPLYDKFYTEQELRDLVNFYKTPTGQKVIDTMPQLFADSTRLAEQNLMPKLLKLLDELIREEFGNTDQPPPPKKSGN